MLFEALVPAILFVASSGLLFNDRFRANRALVGTTGLVALISTGLLTMQLTDMVVSYRLSEHDRIHPQSGELRTFSKPSGEESIESSSLNTAQLDTSLAASTEFSSGSSKVQLPESSKVGARASGDVLVDAGENHSRRTISVISLEELQEPDKTLVQFPSTYFRSRLDQELGDDTTKISRIRIGVAFIEPRDSRYLATGGTVIGYPVVSIPNIANCRLEFGLQTYSFGNANTGIMKAVNDHISEIADWIRRASRGTKLVCPTD